MPSTRAAKEAATAAEPISELTEADPAPVKRKRGRQPKNPTAITPATTDSNGVDAPGKATVSTKTAAKAKANKQVNQSIVSTPSNTGVSNSPDDPEGNNEAPPPKRPRQTTQTSRRDTLPNRSRNKHPGQPDMPRAKRSSAEVQAAMKELQAIEASKMEIEARKLQLYAELELEDEAEQELERQNVIKTRAQVQEEDFEQFSFTAVDAEESEKDEEQDEERVAKKPAKGTKGQTKKAVCIPRSPHRIKMLIGTQKKLKAGEVRGALDAIKNDLQNGSKRKLTAPESSQR